MPVTKSTNTSASGGVKKRPTHVWTTVDCPCTYEKKLADCSHCGNRRRIPLWVPKKVQE